MAEEISEAAEVWRWVIEYLRSLEEFDRQLLQELVESIPDDARKGVEEMLQSPLPAKCTLELLKERILGGFLSDEYSKRWGGVVPDSMECDSVRPMECSGAQINRRLSTGEAGSQSQGSDSIEDDSSSDDDSDDAVLVDTSGANTGVEVQNDLQQSTPAETVHSAGTGGVNRDGTVRLDGKKSVRDDDRDGSVHIEGSSARADDDVQNGKQSLSGAMLEKAKSGGMKTVEDNQTGSILMKKYNARSDDDVQNSEQPSGAVAENPLVNRAGNHNKQVKSGGIKPIETSRSGSSTYVKSSDARANDKQPSSDGVDRPLQNVDKHHLLVKSGENNKLAEENQKGSFSMRSSDNPLSNGDVQNGKQPPAAVVEHPLVNDDENRNRPIQNRSFSLASDARAVNGAQNSKQPSGSTGIERPPKKSDKNPEQVKSGGYGPIEKNQNGFISMKNSDKATQSNGEAIQNCQQPLGSTSGPRADNNRVQNCQQLSHLETEKEQEERLSRKRKMNDFLEHHQLLPVPCSEGPTDLNLCVKCHQTGEVLVCATAGCPMMLHKSCLGFDVEEGREGSFRCPLCSYSRAVAELREAQRRVALTRKDLSGFVAGMQL